MSQENLSHSGLTIVPGPPARDARPGEPVAVDIEIFGAAENRLHRPDEGQFACVSIGMSDGTYLVEDVHEVDEALRRIKRGMWVLHQSTFDLRHLRRWSNVRPKAVWDTMIVERDLFGGWYDKFALSDLSRRWLGILLKKETREEFATAVAMTPERREYAAMDSVITLAVFEAQADYVRQFTNDFRWYWEIDHPMINVVLDMKGIMIDADEWGALLNKSKSRFDVQLEELPFNPRSADQVKAYLKETYDISLRDTKAKTLERALQRYPKASEVLGKIIEARGTGKLVSSYGDNWLSFVEGDGRVYPDWRIVGTETGRTSCASPNMQQIPIRKNPEYRKAVIASPGNNMIVSDVSQQEIRITAFFSHDPTLLDILDGGKDTHLMVSRIIFKDDTIRKSDPRRRIGKDINLGLSYGLTAKGLAKNTGISVAEAEGILKSYFDAFPGIKRGQRTMMKDAVDNYYVRTASGRPIYINPYSRQWENNAINGPIQGTAGDHLKLAAVLIKDEVDRRGLPFDMTLLVHDELGIDTLSSLVVPYSEIVTKAWNEAGDYLIPGIPMKSDIGVGENWGCKE